VIQFSVQSDHLHSIVLAKDKSTLSRGMQGLAISRASTAPRALKNALSQASSIEIEAIPAR